MTDVLIYTRFKYDSRFGPLQDANQIRLLGREGWAQGKGSRMPGHRCPLEKALVLKLSYQSSVLTFQSTVCERAWEWDPCTRSGGFTGERGPSLHAHSHSLLWYWPPHGHSKSRGRLFSTSHSASRTHTHSSHPGLLSIAATQELKSGYWNLTKWGTWNKKQKSGIGRAAASQRHS